MKRPASFQGSFPVMSELTPKVRNILHGQILNFHGNEKEDICSSEDTDVTKRCPTKYIRASEYLIHTIFSFRFWMKKNPSIVRSILIDENLYVKLQCNGSPIPLPSWFTSGRNAKLTRYTYIGAPVSTKSFLNGETM